MRANSTPPVKHRRLSMISCGILSITLHVTMADTTQIDFPKDHYQWLDLVSAEAAERFGLKFNPNDYSAAHGDKCYSYRFKWKKSGIPFERGVFIYLLLSEPPYSGYVRQTRKGWVDPSLWVIDYYRANDGLAKIFDEIENRLFKK